MRAALALIPAALALSACVVTGGDYPRVRYARAVEAGPVALSLAGRPRSDQLRDAQDRWGRAIAEAYACGLDPAAVSEAGMVGAMELAAMSAASRGAQTPAEGVVDYLAALGRRAGDDVPGPDARRCERLRQWVGDVRREGRELLLEAGERFLLPPR